MESFRVEGAPSTVYYIPNFITFNEETNILQSVYSVPKPKWTCLSKRRLQDYGGIPHKSGMIPEGIPQWLQKYIDRIALYNIFGMNKPNHVLVNEYLPGQGIMPHTDGPLFYPTVSTISCGSHTILEFFENNENRAKICDLLLERRSLVVLQDDMYSKYLHSISEVEEDTIQQHCVNLKECHEKFCEKSVLKRNTRISLTIRYVPKVCKIKLLK